MEESYLAVAAIHDDVICYTTATIVRLNTDIRIISQVSDEKIPSTLMT